MAQKLFGTDGIRAVAGQYPLDYSSICVLGGALVRLLRGKGLEPRVLIGRDTRESGPWMEKALVQGILEAGGEADAAGVIPTSAVSYLARKNTFSAGIVISASHNPFRDNGIKVFSHEGVKIPDGWETELEAAILGTREEKKPGSLTVAPDPGLVEEYAAYLKSRFGAAGNGGTKLKVLLDCANGASSAVAPRVLGDLGFEVTSINAAPDGTNINRGCGSLHPEGLARAVVEAGAALGIAYDGDADRAVWVDESGRVRNGDHTLFVQALDMKKSGRLRSGSVVATTMSNMGLEKALEKAGIELVRTRVGDKYVYEEMVGRGANLGGEQSGHTIFLDDFPTGDGILTSLRMLEAIVRHARPLSALVREMEEYPQVLVNVRVSRKPDFEEFPEIVGALRAARNRLKDEGRIDLRYSGTEPLARVMVEAREQSLVDACAGMVAEAVRKHLGEK
jgi:phosphoglucosamine mutase